MSQSEVNQALDEVRRKVHAGLLEHAASQPAAASPVLDLARRLVNRIFLDHLPTPEPEPLDEAPSAPEPELELEPEPAPSEPAEYFNPRGAMAAASELAKLDDELTQPGGANPRDAMQPTPALPAGYTRPTVEQWQTAGYGRELAGDELAAAHKKFFDDYEAELLAKGSAAESASGELSPSA